MRVGLGLMSSVPLLLLAVLTPTARASEHSSTGVLVIGDKIPDQAFLHYDPALRCSVIPFPGFAVSLANDETEAMARYVRMYLPQGEEGRYWEVFERKWKFVIVLPYLTQYHLQYSAATDAWLHLMRYVMNSIIHCSVSVLSSPTQSPPVTVFPYRGGITQSCPECPPVQLERFDLLGGEPCTDFRLAISTSTPFEQFKGTGIEDYHDASLILLARPLSAADAPISVDVWGRAKTRLEEALKLDPAALGDGEVPWLMYCDVSKTQEYGDEKTKEIFSKARGITWACASPVNGPFFFPAGGYVASVPAYNPLSPPQLRRVSIPEEHPYAWDIVSTMIYYSSGRAIPDLTQVHEIRMAYAEYWRKYVDILHLLDWADAWGAAPVMEIVWRDLREVEEKKVKAAALYAEDDYGRCATMIRSALEGITVAKEYARANHKLALFWAHLIQVCVVSSAVLMASSATLYLMDVNRLKNVSNTKLGVKTKRDALGPPQSPVDMKHSGGH